MIMEAKTMSSFSHDPAIWEVEKYDADRQLERHAAQCDECKAPTPRQELNHLGLNTYICNKCYQQEEETVAPPS